MCCQERLSSSQSQHISKSRIHMWQHRTQTKTIFFMSLIPQIANQYGRTDPSSASGEQIIAKSNHVMIPTLCVLTKPLSQIQFC